MRKNILILQHINIETPGYILDLMQRDKFNLTTIELDEGETIPNDIDQFDGMFCMGGPMAVSYTHLTLPTNREV